VGDDLDFSSDFKTWLNIGKHTGVFDFSQVDDLYKAYNYEDALKIASLAYSEKQATWKENADIDKIYFKNLFEDSGYNYHIKDIYNGDVEIHFDFPIEDGCVLIKRAGIDEYQVITRMTNQIVFKTREDAGIYILKWLLSSVRTG